LSNAALNARSEENVSINSVAICNKFADMLEHNAVKEVSNKNFFA
jgi:hypothetical protein